MFEIMSIITIFLLIVWIIYLILDRAKILSENQSLKKENEKNNFCKL